MSRRAFVIGSTLGAALVAALFVSCRHGRAADAPVGIAHEPLASAGHEQPTLPPPAADIDDKTSIVAPPDSAEPSPGPPPGIAPRLPRLCAPDDHGFGAYQPYVELDWGKVALPRALTLDGDTFDLLVHFHMPDAARRVFVHHAAPMVFAGYHNEKSSGAYRKAFSSKQAFTELRADVEREVRARTGNPRARIGRTLLSSWSAGFAAVARIADQHEKLVDGVILLDSLYASNRTGEDGNLLPGTVDEHHLKGAIRLARRASAGERFFYLSHSSVPTPGYASTASVADHLLERLAIRPLASREDPAATTPPLLRTADRGRLHVRGYAGEDEKAHCMHLSLLGEAITLFKQR